METPNQMDSKDLSNATPAKTPYFAPKLVNHGTVQQITQAVSGADTDTVGGSMPTFLDE